MLWGAGLAGAGLAAGAVAGPVPALAASVGSSPARNPAGEADGGEPVIVHVRDARSGDMDVFAGTSQTRLHDRDIAARLVRAARGAAADKAGR
jgi:hypothetical protein